MQFRIGEGYDAHRLAENRRLILGGVEIPYQKGLDGHSDADVLTHAVMDALLGAAGKGDIGRHFPDTDNQYRGISSLTLLEKTGEIIKEEQFTIANIDATIIAQKPKLAPYIREMEENISRTLELQKTKVNIKATTTEHMGFEGREEGISARAVCLLMTP